MPTNGHKNVPETVFMRREDGGREEEEYHGLGQDKSAVRRARAAAGEPASPQTVLRAPKSQPQSQKAEPLANPSGRTVVLSLWVQPLFKEEIQRIAKDEGISMSKAAGAFLKRGLQAHIDMQYGALLEPVLKRVIHSEMQQITDRLAALLVRVAFDVGQTRSITTNILSRQQGVSDEILHIILKEAYKTARSNISRKSPQLQDFLQEVRKFLDEELKPDKESVN